MAKTLQELLASRSPESQARIQKMADELLLETQLHLIREELEISQRTGCNPWNQTAVIVSNRKSWS
jgi:hypothetical protein